MKNAGTVLEFISGMATQDLLRYQMFLSGLERILASTIIETDLSEQTVSEFRKKTTEYLSQAQSSERLAIEAQEKRLLGYTEQDAEKSISGLLRVGRKQLKDTVTAQMRRDALAVDLHFQRIRTTAYLINESRSMGESHAMRLAYLQNKLLLKPVFVDRAGRRWTSGSFVRSTFRQHYLHLINDLEMLSLAGQGAARADLVYPNGKRIAFEIGAELGLLSYAEVKRLYLHPNSSALVRGTLTAD